jgi:hypothetical protein
MPNVWDGTACAQAIDLTHIKPKFLQHLIRLFPKARRNPRGDLGLFF